MKKNLFIATILFIMVNQAKSQQQASSPFPKTITVTGSAEMEIIPDEIYVNIELREYQKKGEDKKNIEIIKAQFFESCKSTGIPDSSISIASYTGYNNYYWWKRKKKDINLNAGITYQVKFKTSELMDRLIEKLDDDATQSFLIVSTSHSKITEFRKQLKIQAVKAAKDKAGYLAEAIGEKTGVAISISEPNEINLYNGVNENIRIRGANSVSYFANEGVQGLGIVDNKGQEVDFKKIKLRFEVTAVFSLQ